MRSESLDEQTCRSLEWHELLEILASLTHSTVGAQRCRNLRLEDALLSAQVRQRETTEMVDLLDSTHPFPALCFQDIRDLLTRAGKGAMLEARELRDISHVIDLVQSVQRCLDVQEEPLEGLRMVVGDVLNLSSLHSSIDRCISKKGEVEENASTALRDAVHEAHKLKQNIRHRLQRLIASEQYRDVLQEPYFAQRDSRYVLPIKAERQGAVPGIIHDGSASGATVFVEPRDLIDLNNRIKVAELQVTREINRILLELSSQVGLESGALERYVDILASLDCITAKARLSKLMKAEPVELNTVGRIHLYQARHPILALTKDTVVPNDLSLGEEDQVLVISGPNTGGKTVMLKLIGLLAFMVRSGLHLPCGVGSQMGFFPHIFADVGDAQDLRKDLSSFSAHMVNIVNLLNSVRSPSPVSGCRHLILLDEVVSSTDPAEGAALGEALLLELARAGLKIVVTTHYNALKILALSSPGFLNASFEIDLPSLTPTYRLIQGFPGGSSAFEIAAHLGLDSQILDHARGLLNREDRKLEHLFTELQELQGRKDKELERAREERVIAERVTLEAQTITEQLQASKAEAAKSFKRRLREDLFSARQEIQQIIEALRKDRSVGKAQKALKHLSAFQQQMVSEQGASGPGIPLDALQIGDRVEISTLETTGTLLDSPSGKQRVRIRVGESEISVASHLLRGIEKGNLSQNTQTPTPTAKKKSRKSETGSQERVASEIFASMTVDVRGQTAEEALDTITAMLDQAALKQFKCIRIIHGHGTGKLKKVTRDYLAQSTYVMTHRSGSEEEGGDGVTFVEMR